jgi:hypothetical protein
MADVNVFDWIRWVDVPILAAYGGWLFAHSQHDHSVEVKFSAEIAELKGLKEAIDGVDRRQDLILRKLLGGQDDDDHA